MKNIRERAKKNFFQKINKKIAGVWPSGSNNQNLKETHALGSKIIATRTDGRPRRWTNFDFMSSAHIVMTSRAKKGITFNGDIYLSFTQCEHNRVLPAEK